MGRTVFFTTKDFFTEAKKRGIVVELTLFSPYYDAAKIPTGPILIFFEIQSPQLGE